MVYEATDDMSAVKKLSIRRGIKSTFGGKSSKKAAKLSAADDNIVVSDDCAVTTSLPVVKESAASFEIAPVVKGNNESEMDAKTRPILTTKGSSKKSYKWPFSRRRSEDNGSVDSEPKTNLSSDRVDNNKPGSTSLENNGELNETGNGVVDDASALGNQCSLPTETGMKHTFQKNGKCGYVVPMRRQQEQSASLVAYKDKVSEGSAGDNMHEISLVNGFLQGDNSEEMRDESDASGRDLNGNPPVSATLPSKREVLSEETADASHHVSMDRYHVPELPLPLKNRKLEPELPPRPPKPASLRYRPPPEPCTSFNGVGDELEDDDIPPRPPARPKNRALGGSLRPWNNLIDDARNNRATVYETISLEPKEASLAQELSKLPRQPWYWGPLTQVQAEEKLAKLPDGSFLVRDSSDERYLLSLSFNSHGRTLHTRIEHRNSLFSLNDSDGHSSVVELIECAVKESRNGVYGYMRDALGVQSFPARLTNWVSRFTEMRSLQHLCRFLIREVYPRHHIQRLPLPKKIKEYILENQY